ncbi:TatD family hydrolase [Longispora albida]|uniref:TatD family hydrolase n=1 Tax=Longispora albida TaxID=203523 RepID=UPI000379D07B|nr:TatD family hydrolase [Longispora albida]
MSQRPPAPEPLPIPVPDSHTHLDIIVGDRGSDGAPPRMDLVRAEITAAQAAGVDRMVQIGVDLASSRWAADLAETEPAVLATVALHPNEAPRVADLDEALREIEALAQRPRVRGLGETGLDYFRTGIDGVAAQTDSFRAHVAFAKQYNKALVIHDREAHGDVLRILKEEGAPDRVVLHCFSGDADFARACSDRGYFLSFAGNVTFKSNEHLRAAALVAPQDQLLVETDAPFLTPVPYRGRPNAPYLVPLTVRFLAELRGESVEDLCVALSANSERAFGAW